MFKSVLYCVEESYIAWRCVRQYSEMYVEMCKCVFLYVYYCVLVYAYATV